MPETERRFRVAVFARNEERSIVTALHTLLGACPAERDLRVHVLVNGCTDRTFEAAQRFSATHPEVRVVEMPFGDKSHAWNTYVYTLADDSPVHFFTDGDVLCSPGALGLMQSALLADEGAMAIAGVPMSGRSRDRLVRYIMEWHWIFGGLYAIKGTQLGKIRMARARLPVGLCGSDHFVSKLAAARSFAPTSLAWEQNIFRPDAGFLFRPLQPYRLTDWRIYFGRGATYTLRQLQIPELDHQELAELPATVDEVNRRILARLDSMRWRLDPFERAVRSRLRRMYPATDAHWFDTMLQASKG